VAQVGRISGPLLEANLLRQGIAANTQSNLTFKNNSSDTSLLKIDVVNGRIGIDKESPAKELQVSQTTQTTNLLSTTANIANLDFANSTIQGTNIYVSATSDVNVSNLETPQFYITDNYISTKDTNANIDLRPWQEYGELDSSNDPFLDGLVSSLQQVASSAIGPGDADYEFWTTVLPSGFQRADWDEDGDIDINDLMGFLSFRRGLISDSTEIGRIKIAQGYAIINAALPNVEVFSNLNITGNLHSTGNITLDGNITFGDADTDSVDFNSDVNSNIIPDQTDIYELGYVTKAWETIHSRLINGQDINTGVISVNGIDLSSRPGNIIYVSKDGINTNVGDHPGGSLLTIEEAIARVDASTAGPVTINVAPGLYEENLPLILPNDVSIQGLGIRSASIAPATGSESKDVFHLNDSSSVANVTIRDYQYDSVNNTGYAFRFASGAVITNRSPYIQDVTVITSGSVTSASDPRGFDEGDAGKGAWIDGAEIDSSSIEASMLFHAATFITPGVDAITMTNGVRVEWLNSFTYFANRGLYAVNGSTGRTAYGTTNYGAEIRSIGSANVYGNFGAVADGSDTLMYLLQHNFGYIGAGKFVDNDDSKAIQSQEVTELNSGKINFVTTDHTGGFRIGDNFFVDFETGNTSINIDTLTVNQFNGLRVNTGANTTVIDGGFIDTGNISISNTNLQSVTGDLNVVASTGTINLQDNTNISGNVDISGDLSYAGALNIKGDDPSDTIKFNVEFEQDFNPHQHQKFALGSFTKRWLTSYLDRLEINDISIYDNVIETNSTSADLELRANGAGNILIPSNLSITNDLNVVGTTDIQSTTITGNLVHNGDKTQTGNLDIAGEISNGNILIEDNFITTTNTNSNLELSANGTNKIVIPANTTQIENNFLSTGSTTFSNVSILGTLNVTGTLALAGDFTSDSLDANGSLDVTGATQFEEILVDDNFITTTTSNTSLELRASGTGTVDLQDTVNVANNLTAGDTTATNANITLNTTTDNANIGNIEVNDNYIEVTTVDGSLTLAADRNVIVTGTDTTFQQDLTVGGASNLQALDVTGSITHIGDTLQTGDVILNGEWTIGNTYIEDNFIAATQLNADLDLRATDGYVVVPNNDVTFGQDLTVSGNSVFTATQINGTLTHVGNAGTLSQFGIPGSGQHFLSGTLTANNIIADDNFITTTSGNLILEATGNIDIDSNNVEIANDLDVDGITNLDVTNINGTLTQVGDRTQTGDYDIGGELTVDNVYIEDNFITTTAGNLSLGATGDINVDANDVVIAQNLTVSGTTSLQDTTITGAVTHVGNTTQTGNLNIAGEISTGDILIEDNFITTTVVSSYSVGGTIRLNEVSKITDAPTITDFGEYNELWFFDETNYQLNQDATTTRVMLNTPGSNIVDYGAQVGDYFSITKGSTIFVGQITGLVAVTSIDAWEYTEVYKTGYIDNNVDNVTEVTVTLGTELIPSGNLELRANSTGEVVIDTADTLTIQNNLTVGGTLTYQGFLTINGDVVLLGNTQDGSLTVTNDFDVTGTLDISSQAQFEDVRIEDNFITTTLSNSNLELRANGTGEVLFAEDVDAKNNLSTLQLNAASIAISNLVSAEEFKASNGILIYDNVITATSPNIELRTAGTGSVYLEDLEITNTFIGTLANIDSTSTDITFSPTESLVINANTSLELPIGSTASSLGNLGDIRFNTDDNLFEGTGSNNSTVTFGGGVYSSDRQTSITADPTSNNIRFIIDGSASLLDSSSLVSEITGEGLTVNAMQVDDILLDDNTITTNVSTSNLDLAANGTGELVLDDINLKGNLIKDNGSSIIIKQSGYGTAKFTGPGVTIPYGSTAERPAGLGQPDPLLGDTRWNTTTDVLEVWDGTQYVSAQGSSAAITPQEFDDLLLEFTLIFG
jgi:hypothetical protein